MIIDTISIILIVAGLVFFFGSVVGVIRFPDFYTRMHAAGKGDTLSSLLVVMGFAVYYFGQIHWTNFAWADLLVIVKLLAICAFIMLTSPTATHALMDAGYEDGIEPLTRKEGNALSQNESE
ncbi:MAG: monovalent cation/H(+) antiporter subunit G [Arenicellales bacterium]|jgi:multicomponent Na+:H+ antiporter subunit G|nr:monovalent cation/H(+) antiporter subunit G [Arenicellales bacterium]